MELQQTFGRVGIPLQMSKVLVPIVKILALHTTASKVWPLVKACQFELQQFEFMANSNNMIWSSQAPTEACV